MTGRNNVTFSERPTRASKRAHNQARLMYKGFDTSLITPKQSKLPIIFGVLVAVLVTLALVFLVMHFFVASGNSQKGLLPQDQTATITVVSGDSASVIAAELERAGLIADADKFTKRVAALGAESSLQAGTYVIPGGLTVDEIIDILKKGVAIDGDALVIPEGYTLAQIAAAVEEVSQGRITAADFTAAAVASRWTSEFPFTSYAGSKSLEGMLFPATYGINASTTADSLIRQMLTAFQHAINGLDTSVATDMGLTWYQWLELASIIQAEALPGQEAAVAGVFYNRLASDMPLQSDATTAYTVGGLPTADQLHDYDDPYNTYSYDRLGVCIPTPIGNPGLACLEAACSPEKSDYLYFYTTEDAQGNVTYHYSETYEEHNAVIDGDRD